jgi:hypothetical protein
MTNIRSNGALPDVDDHRAAVNLGERLAWKPGRVHASRDDDQGILGHGGGNLWVGDKLSRYH